MPRLQVIVSRNGARQVFDLDAELISIGSSPESTMVLPLPFVAPTHLLLSDAHYEGRPGVRVTANAPDCVALIQGVLLPPPPEGLLVGEGGGMFVVEIPAFTGAPLRLEFGSVPEVAKPKPVGSRVGRELVGGLMVLMLAVVVGGYVLLPGRAPATEPAAQVAAAGVTPSVSPTSNLAGAAAAYSAGDLGGAQAALDRAAAAGEYGPLADAISQAVQAERKRRASPRQEAPPPHAAEAAPPAPTPVVAPVEDKPEPQRVLFEGRSMTAADRDALLLRREADRKRAADRVDRERADAAALRELLAKAESDARQGREAKLTPTGRAALTAAKDAVRTRLSVAGGAGGTSGEGEAARGITFPENSDERVIVLFSEGIYTVRGYIDQWNPSTVPVRIFFLVRLRPAITSAQPDAPEASDPQRFDVLSSDFLK